MSEVELAQEADMPDDVVAEDLDETEDANTAPDVILDADESAADDPLDTHPTIRDE